VLAKIGVPVGFQHSEQLCLPMAKPVFEQPLGEGTSRHTSTLFPFTLHLALLAQKGGPTLLLRRVEVAASHLLVKKLLERRQPASKQLGGAEVGVVNAGALGALSRYKASNVPAFCHLGALHPVLFDEALALLGVGVQLLGEPLRLTVEQGPPLSRQGLVVRHALRDKPRNFV